MVSGYSIFFIILTFIISTFIPVSLMIFLKLKYNTSLKSFFIGMVAFFIAVQVLETPVHYYLLNANETTANLINSNPIIYMLYGGLTAGLFEETARLLCFKFLLKKYRSFDDGLAYGLGHGGIEAILVAGVSSLYNFTMAQMINTGNYKSLYEVADAPVEFLDGLLTQMTTTSPFMFGMSGFERIFALIIQIGLTLIILKAVKENNLKYYFLAIILHATVNFPAALYQYGAISNIYIVEVILLVFACCLGYYVYKEYLQDKKQKIQVKQELTLNTQTKTINKKSKANKKKKSR